MQNVLRWHTEWYPVDYLIYFIHLMTFDWFQALLYSLASLFQAFVFFSKPCMCVHNKLYSMIPLVKYFIQFTHFMPFH